MKKLSRSRSLFSLESDPIEEYRHNIEETFIQLNQLIENLDFKIKKRLDINEAHFVIAFKSHMSHVTQQLKHLKQKHDEIVKKFSADSEIVRLKRQCFIFKQSATNLSSQIGDIVEENKGLNWKIKMLKDEVKSSEQKTKEVLKKLRKQEEKVLQLEQKMAEQKVQNQKIQEIKRDNFQSFAFKSQKTFKTNPKIKDKHFITLLTKNYSGKSKTFGQTVKSHHNQTFSCLTNRNILSQRAKQRPASVKKNRGNLFKEISSKDLQIFQKFFQFVKEARKKQIKNSVCLESKTTAEFLFHEKDILNFSRLLFPALSIQFEQTDEGTRFFAERKTNRQQSLTYLSTQLMEKYEIKKTSQEEEKSSEKSMIEENQNSLFFGEKILKQKKIARVEQSFKKKKYINTERKTNFQNYMNGGFII